jgi:hypothetical protein
MALPFPADLRGVPDRTGPRSLSLAGSSPRELRRLFRVLRARHLPAARTRRTPRMEFSASFTTRARGVHYPAAFPTPPTFRPQRFSRSRRLAPPRTSRACFIPQPRMRFPLQGFPPATSRADSSPARSPLDVSAVLLRKGCPDRTGSRRVACRGFILLPVHCRRQVF